jgi:DNA polymerase (family 10)
LPVQNSEIADVFYQVADLLEIEGANQFRVRAYRHTARTIATLPQGAAEMVAAGEDLDQLSGIGEDLVAKIEEIVENGELEQFEELEQAAEDEEIREINGLGPTIEQDILEDLERSGYEDERTLLRVAEQTVEPLVDYLSASPS